MDINRHGIKVPRTESEGQAARAARALLINGAREVGRKFTHPEDDWHPIWAVLTQDQGTIIETGAREANDPRAKTKITQYVADFARRRGAIAIGSLMSTWQVILDVEKLGEQRVREIERQVRAQDGSTEGIEGRVERLLVITYTAGNVESQHAPINRHDNAPPTLGEFAAIGDLDHLEGRMTEPLQEALRRIG